MKVLPTCGDEAVLVLRVAQNGQQSKRASDLCDENFRWVPQSAWVSSFFLSFFSSSFFLPQSAWVLDVLQHMHMFC